MVYQGLQEPAMKEQGRIFELIAIAWAAVSVFTGIGLFKRKLLEIRNRKGTSKGKFTTYRSECILQWGLSVSSLNKNDASLQQGMSVEEL